MMGFELGLMFLLISAVCGIEDYCAKNTFNSSENFMHFTKEATFEEFAIIKKFKGLHCCAKGYRSIEWYKDDKLYPWPLETSNFIIFPESANQTIYTQDVKEADAGNYTCVLKNDTVIHSHTIHLKVFEKVPDDAKITYISKDTEISAGENLRLFCEAFAGQFDLPDAYTEANWKKVAANGSIYDVPSQQQLKTTREDGQTFGTYLLIPNVEKDDFGRYKCIISKPGNTISKYVTVFEKVERVEQQPNQNALPLGKLVLIMSGFLFVVLLIVVFYIKFGLKLRVSFKEALDRPDMDDGKKSDALIIYSPQDNEIALGVLATTLSTNYCYSVVCKELNSNVSTWYFDLKPEAEKCRRILLVLSPSILNNAWDSPTIVTALEQLKSLGKIVVITLKDLPKSDVETKNSQGESLRSLTRKMGVVQWERDNVNFWYSLRLKMPARGARQGTDDLRLKNHPDESV